MNENLKGFLSAILAFLIWGLLPFYWKKLINIPALEIIAYRILMTFIFLVILQSIRKDFLFIRLFMSKNFITAFASAVFLAMNWLIYVWGVNNSKIIECSLGYYITPLVSVLFGRLFFKENFTRLQFIAICLAFFSVMILSVKYGKIPYVAIGLAMSFSLYSVVRKKSKIESMNGLLLETGVLSSVVLTYLVVYGHNLLDLKALISTLLILSGVVTAAPLLLYVFSIRVLRLSTVGMLQYIGPTMMFLIGLFVYNEPFELTHFLSFVLIWISVFIFIFELKRVG